MPFDCGRREHGDGTQTRIKNLTMELEIPMVGTIYGRLRVGAYASGDEVIVMIREFSVGLAVADKIWWKHYEFKEQDNG